jgi:TatD DNase family protein
MSMSAEVCSVDAHVHISYYLDRAAVIDAATEAGVIPAIVTNRPSEYRDLLSVLGGRPGIRLGLGLHPENAGGPYVDHELRILREHFAKAHWIAEVGLDATLTNVGSSFVGGTPPTLDAQERMLEQVLELDVSQKILSVHSRHAEDRLIAMLHEARAGNVIFHWYIGNVDAARRAVNLGFYFSINPEMLTEAPSLDVVRWLPSDRVLLETDGPFTKWDGRIAEPKDVIAIAGAVADIRNESVDDLLECVIRNFTSLEKAAP